MKGLGTDEKAIINVLANRSAAQRLQIETAYKGDFGRDLIADLKSELTGQLEDVVTAMMQDRFVYEAQCLRGAMKGAGTTEGTLIELIVTKSNEEIQKLKAAYTATLKRNLEDDVESETSGTLKRLLVSALQGARPANAKLDPARVTADAKALFEAGENSFGTDESKFNEIIIGRSFNHVQAVFAEYEKLAGHSILKAIESEMGGAVGIGFKSVATSIINRPAYFAGRLYDSMAGAGTDDESLIRIIVTRSEVDLEDIKAEYVTHFKKSLGAAISDDCGGDFKRVLLALIKE